MSFKTKDISFYELFICNSKDIEAIKQNKLEKKRNVNNNYFYLELPNQEWGFSVLKEGNTLFIPLTNQTKLDDKKNLDKLMTLYKKGELKRKRLGYNFWIKSGELAVVTRDIFKKSYKSLKYKLPNTCCSVFIYTDKSYDSNNKIFKKFRKESDGLFRRYNLVSNFKNRDEKHLDEIIFEMDDLHQEEMAFIESDLLEPNICFLEVTL